MFPGDQDMRVAVEELAAPLPVPLRPLAFIAHNYRWSWLPDGPATFSALDADRWARCGGNPKRLLREIPPRLLERAARDGAYLERVAALEQALRDDLARPADTARCPAAHPVAFMCAEFGLHPSLPVYSGGLGVLAGDVLKEASDLALCVVALLGLVVAVVAPKRAFTSKIVPSYMSGIQTSEPFFFLGPMNQPVKAEAKNYYLDTIFGEDRLTDWVNLGGGILLTLIVGGAL